MLQHLHIRDFAIIDALELELGPGLTVLSGETGAGKSILIDAIGLLLGDRADAAMVRAGSERAELVAEFSLDNCPAARHRLEHQDLLDPEEEHLCRIRRVVGADGRSRAYLNGSPTQLAVLREIGELLIEVHGQHEHQRLVRPEAQRELLDAFGAYPQLLSAVAGAADEHARLEREIRKARDAARESPERIEELRLLIEELEAANPRAGEYEDLSRRQSQLANAERLLREGGQAMDALDGGEDTAYDRLGSIRQLLEGLVQLHPDFEEINQLTAAAQIQVQEAAAALRKLLDRLDQDPQQLREAEQRMEALHDLARKHRVRPANLPEKLETLRTDLDAAGHAAGHIETLEKQRADVARRYRKAADELTLARMQAARGLAERASAEIRELGMPQATFHIEVSSASRSRPGPSGDDEIRFDFSANPGQPARPLSKVASGGELSRISLALQVVALADDAAPTMIFDEVDTGIGGATAEIVGRKLHGLADGRQVLCVTHLAQVAAQAHRHLRIYKEVINNQTFTRVGGLSADERIRELARMLGGLEKAATAQAHARELLSRAQG